VIRSFDFAQVVAGLRDFGYDAVTGIGDTKTFREDYRTTASFPFLCEWPRILKVSETPKQLEKLFNVKERLTPRPRFRLHPTPTLGFFTELSRELIRDASFTSLGQFVQSD
jgi:hypothetical protein